MTPPQQLHSNINDLLNVEGQRFSIYSLEQWTKLRAVTLSVRSPEVVGTWVTNGQVRNKISPEGGQRVIACASDGTRKAFRHVI